MNKTKYLAFVAALALIFNLSIPNNNVTYAASGDAQWAKSTGAGSSQSYFAKVSADSSGNTYAVGSITGTSEFDFGNSVTVTGGSVYKNVVIVKYNSSGVAQWAKSTGAGSSQSYFEGVSVDSSGNTYAVGSITGTSEFDFGNSVKVTGGSASANVVIVKYNSSGIAQWAKSTVVGPDYSTFYGVTVDASGNIYTAGYITGTSEFDFGNSVIVTGGSDYDNVVIVKYNSSGIVQWARSAVIGPDDWSSFFGVTTDDLGNIYAVGEIDGIDEFDFGNNVTATPGNASGSTVIVKYNSSGIAQWAKSTVVGPDFSFFIGVTTDNLGNIYAVGEIDGIDEFDFGNNVTVTGGSASANVVIVKYNSSGIVQWARSAVVGPDWAYFNDVFVDPYGNIYAVGEIDGTSEFDFGNSVTTSGSASENAVIVKYNSNGIAQWAKSTVVGPDDSIFYAVTTDNLGNIYAVGEIDGTGEYDFGNSVTVTGGSAYDNFVIVKYAGDASPSFLDLPGENQPVNITEGQTITTNPYTIRVMPTDDVGITRVEFYADNNLICTNTTADSNGIYSCDWDTSKYYSEIRIVAYDTVGQTTTLTRSVTVRLSAGATLPETGRENNTGKFLWFLITTGLAGLTLRKIKATHI